jgi:hypothetical protein
VRQVFPELRGGSRAHLLQIDCEGKIGIMASRLTWPLWRPPDEALESIAAAIAAHWNAAKAYHEHLFWPGPESWLRSAYHFTRGAKLIK